MVFNIELAPGQSKKRSSSLHHRNIDQGSMAQYLQKCKRVFQGKYILLFLEFLIKRCLSRGSKSGKNAGP